MKIGIGVTTYNRPKHLELWVNQANKFTEGVPCYVADDSQDRKGIAYRKNECLKALKDCDYIFLFDDDTVVLKEGWAEFFIMAHELSGQHHFMYLKDTPGTRKIKEHLIIKENGWGINEYKDCSGCMMFFTKEVIEKVGAYNPKYLTYGYEHAGYSNRIHKSGLTPLGAYTCPAGAGDYIYSLDLDHHLPFNRQVNHKPSIEINKLSEYVEQNKAIYLQDTEIYIPL